MTVKYNPQIERHIIGSVCATLHPNASPGRVIHYIK